MEVHPLLIPFIHHYHVEPGHGIQPGGSIHAIKFLTPDLITVNAM